MSASRRVLRWLAALGLLVVVATVALVVAWTLLPGLARGPGAQYMSRLLQRPVTLESIRLEPLELAIHLGGLKVGEPGTRAVGDRPFASLDDMDLRLAPESLRRALAE